MGPVAAAASVAYELARQRVKRVFLWGLAGAYPGSGLDVPSLVLVSEEFFGDLALCRQGKLEDFSADLPVRRHYQLSFSAVNDVSRRLKKAGLRPTVGPAVTVCCASASKDRGLILERRYGALVENMEGAAVAQAAELAGVEMVELRVVSNLVLDREEADWRIEEALALGQRAIAALEELFG